MCDIGRQYEKDDAFKAAARLHQSNYRARVLRVGYDEYGNRLTDSDARALLNYYPSLGVTEALRARFPSYSKMREGDMLRSEHIPFNLFAPLRTSGSLAANVVTRAFGIDCIPPVHIEFEYAPEPKHHYLDDATAFDVLITFTGSSGLRVGIGIEVKYTEGPYKIGKTEKKKVEDVESPYWDITRRSGRFVDPSDSELGTDDLRQIWRNHLLGLAMLQSVNPGRTTSNGPHSALDQFHSITLCPNGNAHITHAIGRYRSKLLPSQRDTVKVCRYTDFIEAIDGDEAVMKWMRYLRERYVVGEDAGAYTRRGSRLRTSGRPTLPREQGPAVPSEDQPAAVGGGARMSQNKDQVHSYIDSVLNRFSRTVTDDMIPTIAPDITDRVYLMIESEEDLLREFEEFAGGKHPSGKSLHGLNSQLGKAVKDRFGLVNAGKCTSPRSRLIKSYTRHAVK